MGKLKEIIKAKREMKNHRKMDRWNLRETNIMRKWESKPDPDAWLFGIEWDEKRKKYRLSDTAFENGLKKNYGEDDL